MSLVILLLLFLWNPAFASALLGAAPVSWQRSFALGHDYSKIRKGEIYVQEHFLTPAQVELLRKDITQLQQQSTDPNKKTTFQPSGLSNRVVGDRNEFGSSDRLTCTITPDLVRGNTTFSDMRLVVEEKLEALKVQLQEALSSPLDAQNVQLELAEMYYSVSPKGSHLPRHQDERHEETKGSKGWIKDTRRSISWLIYLNEDGWGGKTSTEKDSRETQNVISDKESTPNIDKAQSADERHGTAGHGGDLRAYVRKCCVKQGVQCGSHDGNIQVGWLRMESPVSSSSVAQERIEYEPIFLDSWVKTRTQEPIAEGEEEEHFNDALEWQAMSALYRIRTEDRSSESENRHEPLLQHENQNPLREYLSPPFGPNSPSWPSDSNLEPTDFASALQLQLSNLDHQRLFVGVEDVASACEIVDVLPNVGTLVLFDSVAVPHEVLEVTKGNRLAIAGWYHEPQQDFPEWYGT